MTEEEARPEDTPPGALQPDEKIEGQESLTDKNNDLLTGTLRFQQTKEQKTMINSPEQDPKKPQTPGTPEYARDEFLEIKKALVGPKKEWCLPRIDDKAKKSSPMIEDEVLNKLKKVCDSAFRDNQDQL
jgi:hypothetical protein